MEKYFVKYAGTKLMYRGEDAIDALEKFKNRMLFGETMVKSCSIIQEGRNKGKTFWVYCKCVFSTGKVRYVLIEQEM